MLPLILNGSDQRVIDISNSTLRPITSSRTSETDSTTNSGQQGSTNNRQYSIPVKNHASESFIKRMALPQAPVKTNVESEPQMDKRWKRLPRELVLCVMEKAVCNYGDAVRGSVGNIRLLSKSVKRAIEVQEAFQKLQAKSISKRALVAKDFIDFRKLLFGLRESDVGAATLITKTQTGHILNFSIASLQANLITLGYRIADYERSSVYFSIKNFKEAFEMIPEGERSDHLCDLERAVTNTPNTIVELRTSRSIAAVERGENIQIIATEHGIASDEQINALQRRAVNGIAGERVQSGESVKIVANEHGITDSGMLKQLEWNAVIGNRNAESGAVGPALAAARNGENVQEICKRHGITDPDIVKWLELNAVIGDRNAKGGAMGPAGEAARNGGNVQDICTRYGITNLSVVRRLQQMSINP